MAKLFPAAIAPFPFGELISFSDCDDDDAVDSVDFGLFLNGFVNPENLPAF